ncbi:MAG TPA: hopanoid-associated sugar epimerase [Steroidobacteraceae bacterium]|nr:hopanoid-associated sugar epimerase [Steroidobacteraceae bacterium]
MKVLVTGATGFVGAAVARALVARGDEVRCLVRADSDRRNLAGLAVEAVVGDLNEEESLAHAAGGCEVLFHVAADYRLWARDPRELYRVNVEGTGKLLRAARRAGIERTVYTSSVSTIGFSPDGTPGDESTPLDPRDLIGHYKRSKFLAEQLVRDVARENWIVIVNPSTPIGPGDVKPTPTGQVILDAVTGRMPAFVDTGLNVVHVDDVAAGHLLALERGRAGERYILGGEDMTLQAILGQLASLAGREPPRVRLPHGAVLPLAYAAESWARLTRGHTRITVDGVRMARKRMYFSSSRAVRELGYRWRPPLEALTDAVAWFRDNGYLSARSRSR